MEANYRRAFKAAISRVYHGSGVIVGAGFLVSERYLLTCAHVVTAALGIATETVEMPTALVELDFPLIAPGQKVSAKVVFWQSVNGTQTGEDVAGLELEAALPEASEPVRLVKTEEFWNHPFQVFGFPSKRDDGIWASGVLRDRLANGWVQMEDIKAQGQAVQPGFSGSPIWDEELQGVVGMAVAADKKRDETKTAFMIPVSVIAARWAALEEWIAGTLEEAGLLECETEVSNNLRHMYTEQLEARLEQLNRNIATRKREIERLEESIKDLGEDREYIKDFTPDARISDKQRKKFEEKRSTEEEQLNELVRERAEIVRELERRS